MTKRIATLALALVVIVGLAGCAKTVAVSISSIVPATQAELKTSRDNNDNPVVELKVKHLAPPQNLTPSKSVYVAWVETPDGRIFNAGRLKLNDDLEGQIRIMTPYPRFRLVISAEDDPLAARPGSQRVVETEQVEIN